MLARLHQPLVIGALVLTLLSLAERGDAVDRFVSVAGSDGANDCLASATPCGTIGHALTQVLSGDVMKVTEGQFVEPIGVFASTALTLSGGWSLDFSSQDPAAYSTLKQSLFVIGSMGDVIDLVVERFTFTGSLGGVVVESGDDASVTVTFQDCVVKRTLFASFFVGARATNPLTLTLSNFRQASKRTTNGPAVTLLAEGGTLDATMDGVIIERNRRTDPLANATLLVTASFGGSVSLVGDDVSIVKNARPGLTVRSYDTASCSVALTNARVRDNRNGGVVAFGAGTSLSLTDSVVTRNRGRDTGIGGLSLLDGTYSIVNSSIRGNRSACCTAGLITDGSVDMTNTILWDNRTVGGPADNLEIDAGASVDVARSDIGPGVSGTYNDLGGNISADPLFVGSRDEHLRPGSPAIDTGTCVGAPVTDFDGDPRPSGAGCDMGADEVVP